MFIGEYSHSIDEKGRLAVPVKFRPNLKKGAVITRGLDGCLFIYTAQEWKKLADKLNTLPLAQEKSRAFARLMLAGAMEVTLDSQGRVLVPDYLRKYANVQKQVVITGLYNRLELWDDTAWNTYKTNTERSSVDIAEALSSLGV